MREWVTEQAELKGEETVLLDGLDGAIVGYVYADGGMHTVYDEHRIMEIIRDRDEVTDEDAREWFHYNVEGLGDMDGGPIFMVTPGVS